MFDVAQIPLSLYVHVPWCVKKCPYCDFNSHTLPQAHDFADYVDALIADAQDQVRYVQGRALSSIFFGGGTPSLLPVHELARLMTALRELFDFSDDIEITLEANPGTLEHAPFAQYLDAGINRLSLGVQSFSDAKLTKLGRVHDSTEAKLAIQRARAAGFDRLNVDLMHGLPEQTEQEALTDLQSAIDCGATHVSWYQLTIEPNTAFYRNTPVLPQEDVLADIQCAGEALLKNNGFHQYEVSAWTSEQPSKHNVNYWQFGDYLAIGAGAHGKVTMPQPEQGEVEPALAQGVYRFQNSRLPKDYLATRPAKRIHFEAVSKDNMPFEFMMNALRLLEGVPAQYYAQRTGIPLGSASQQEVVTTLNNLAAQGMIVDKSWQARERIRCTELGMRFLNQVLNAFH